MGLRHDYRTALRAVVAPVLVIHGAADLQPEETTRVYLEAFPNASFQVIKGAEHFSFEEQPAFFADLVTGFLEKLS